MNRSLWKNTFIDNHLFKIINSNKKIINIYSRRSIIYPFFINKKVNIYNGKTFITRIITSDMIGHKFGEFALTRQLYLYKNKKKK